MLDYPTIIQLEPLIKLWPSIIVALIITIWRSIVDKLFLPMATKNAHRQINTCKPAWIDDLILNKHANGNTNGNCIKHTITTSEIKAICETSSRSKLMQYFTTKDIHLTQIQKRELKSYYKAINEFSLKRDKLLESLFKVSVVTLTGSYGFYICIIRNNFFINHREQWPPYPSVEPYRQEHDVYILWYYIISLGYHLQRTCFQYYNPSRRDFHALFIHHWSTITCIICSYFASFLRTGCLVLFIHENSDIFLEFAKICGYMGYDFFREFFFILFVLSWIIMRMFCFSYKVLYEIIRFGYKQLFINNSPLLFNWICVVLLFVLEGLHLYWFGLISQMLVKKIKGEKLRDIRSETETEDEEKDALQKHQ